MSFRKHEPPREPRRVADLIDGLSVTGGWTERLALGKLRDRWPEIAGPVVAANAEPIRLERGVLTIRASSGAWATELSLLWSRLVARAEAVLGARIVTDVRVVSGEITPRPG